MRHIFHLGGRGTAGGLNRSRDDARFSLGGGRSAEADPAQALITADSTQLTVDTTRYSVDSTQTQLTL